MNGRVGIVGFRGYSGAELVRLLGHHRQVEVALLDHREDSDISSIPTPGKQHERAAATPEAAASLRLDLVFLATPAEVSMELAPAMLRAGARVIDLSGAFRFRDAETYSRWY